MGMILRIASSRIVGQGDIVGRSGYFSLNLSANSVMRGRLDARRTLKSLVADLRKYIPVFMTGMGRSLPKGELILLPYKASIFYGTPAVAGSTDVHEILKQITDDFEMMKDKYQVVTEDDE